MSTTIITRGRRATLIDWFPTKRRRIVVITVILLVLAVLGAFIAMPERQEAPFGPLPSLAVSDASFTSRLLTGPICCVGARGRTVNVG